MSYAYKVIHHEPVAGLPVWKKDADPYVLIACHDTEGGAGEQGAWNTLSWMVATGPQRGASYHEFWAWDVTPSGKRFTVIRAIDPRRYCAGSVNPWPVSSGGHYAPDAWVRERLGKNVADPNQGIYAVSIAGTKAQVNAWAADPDFASACQRRCFELREELGIKYRAEHFRFNPGHRTDWGTALMPALGGLTIPADAPEGDINMHLRPVADLWTARAGTPFWVDGPDPAYAGPGTKSAKPPTGTLAGTPAGVAEVTIAEEWVQREDGSWTSGSWRVFRFLPGTPGRTSVVWVHRADLTPLRSGGAKAYADFVDKAYFGTDYDPVKDVIRSSSIGGQTAEQVKAAISTAVKAATDPLLRRISTIKAKVAGTAADVADD